MRKQLLFLLTLMLMITPACKRHPKHPNIAQGVAIATGSALTIASVPLTVTAAQLTVAASHNIFLYILFWPTAVGLWAAAGGCLIIGLPLIITGALTLKDAKPSPPQVSIQSIIKKNLSPID